MKKIILRLYSFWGVFNFLIFFIVFQPVYLILLQFRNEKARGAVHWLNGVWGRYIFLMSFIRLKVTGREKLNRRQHYLFISNHISYLDIAVCNISIRHSFRFLGKAELSKAPFFGYMFNNVHVPVNRDSKVHSFKSSREVAERLNAGISVLIYPEGTIPDKHKVDMLPFKAGAFRLAIETGVPLAPLVAVDTHHLFADDGKWQLYPGIVHVEFMDPIPTSHLRLEDADNLMNEVREKMLKRLYELGYKNLKGTSKNPEVQGGRTMEM